MISISDVALALASIFLYCKLNFHLFTLDRNLDWEFGKSQSAKQRRGVNVGLE